MAVRAKAVENTQHVRARAYMGVKGEWLSAVRVLAALTSLPIALFDTRDEAMDYLAEME